MGLAWVFKLKRVKGIVIYELIFICTMSDMIDRYKNTGSTMKISSTVLRLQ